MNYRIAIFIKGTKNVLAIAQLQVNKIIGSRGDKQVYIKKRDGQ